ncbi:MAG TPA: hypothetical protein VHC69_21890 [Polyangiaceae bacterium]|nr:hypothetical protein [Polyangiaceae bacterium]
MGFRLQIDAKAATICGIWLARTVLASAYGIIGSAVLFGCGSEGAQGSVGTVQQKLGTNGPFTITTTTPILIPATQLPHGFDGPTVAAMTYTQAYAYSDPDLISEWSAIRYVQDAVMRMKHVTTRQPVVSSSTLDSGIVLTLLSYATADIAQASSIIASNGSDAYNANEAYYVRTETTPARVIVLANTYVGLNNGVVDLLGGDHYQTNPPVYSVGYEVLGMGPDWINVPDYTNRDLSFWEAHSERPGFYIRELTAMGGQDHSGTLTAGNNLPQNDPDNPNRLPDETVEYSYLRWRVGSHLAPQAGDFQSEPSFPGQSLQNWHVPVCVRLASDVAMNFPGSTTYHPVTGFLQPALVGPLTARPAASSSNANTIYIGVVNGDVNNLVVSVSNGTTWPTMDQVLEGIYLDQMDATVRDVLRLGMIRQFKNGFWAQPNATQVFATEAEDDQPNDSAFLAGASDKSWWLNYCKAPSNCGSAWENNDPYKLNGFFSGLPSQSNQKWWWNPPDPSDPNSVDPNPDLANAQSDNTFALNTWLLQQYDQYVQKLPTGNDHLDANGNLVECQNTSTGKSKSSSVITSLYSTAYHDVPPNFNMDGRIRVEPQTGFSKHRGLGKWANCVSYLDAMRAFRVLAPTQSGGRYDILSQAGVQDIDVRGVYGSRSSNDIQSDLSLMYTSGGRAYNAEIDFNFGKHALDYYLTTQELWSPSMSAAQLDAKRTRWIQRAYGPGATAMQSYYDLMTPQNWFDSAHYFETAMGYIDQAEAAINNTTSPYQVRLDDTKQFFYYYYLLDSVPRGTWYDNAQCPQCNAFIFRGQMSYTTAMLALVQSQYGVNVPTSSPKYGSTDPFVLSDPTYTGASKAMGVEQAAHFTHAQTQVWWNGNSPANPPANSVEGRWLASKSLSQQISSSIDQNDLVTVRQFTPPTGGYGSLPIAVDTNADGYKPPIILQSASAAGATLGLKIFRPYPASDRQVFYSVDYWDSSNKKWVSELSGLETFVVSQQANWTFGGRTQPVELIAITYQAPAVGTYRFTLQLGQTMGNYLASLGYNLDTATYTPGTGTSTAFGTPQLFYPANAGFWAYVPKGTSQLVLENGFVGSFKGLTGSVDFYKGLPSTGMTYSRNVTFPSSGVAAIPVNTDEQGSLVHIRNSNNVGNATEMMVKLYSVPGVYAQDYPEVLVPRAIATADGLTPW